MVLIVNELGDHQMERYFPGGADSNGGMMCEGDISGPQFDDEFQRMDDHYHESFERVGGEYIKREHEKKKTCAIRLARTVFFEVCACSVASHTHTHTHTHTHARARAHD